MTRLKSGRRDALNLDGGLVDSTRPRRISCTIGHAPRSAPLHFPVRLHMDIEAAYRERVNSMSIAERIRRAETLFNWSRDYIARSILASRGSIPDADLRWEVALRQYGSQPEIRELIDDLRGRVSR